MEGLVGEALDPGGDASRASRDRSGPEVMPQAAGPVTVIR